MSYTKIEPMSKQGDYYKALVKANGKQKADILIARASYNMYNFSMDDSRKIKKWRPRNEKYSGHPWLRKEYKD